MSGQRSCDRVSEWVARKADHSSDPFASTEILEATSSTPSMDMVATATVGSTVVARSHQIQVSVETKLEGMVWGAPDQSMYNC